MSLSTCYLEYGSQLARLHRRRRRRRRRTYAPMSNSPLWKRVITWERSRAASGYGIIWGDADRNKQEEFSAECHSEVIVLDDQKSRETWMSDQLRIPLLFFIPFRRRY